MLELDPDHEMQFSFGFRPDPKPGEFNIETDINLTLTLLLDILVDQPQLSRTQADISNTQAPKQTTPKINIDWDF